MSWVQHTFRPCTVAFGLCIRFHIRDVTVIMYILYSNIYATRCNVTQFIYIWKLLYVFRVVPPPIIRSAYVGWYLHLSSGAHTTVSTASGIRHTVTATFRYRGGVGTWGPTLPRQRQVAVTVWQIAVAVDTVVCAPDDGWRYHPKHVEQFPDKINCVTLHLVGYILEHTHDARTLKR